MSRKTTSRDVAAAAGVSQCWVSIILNNVPNKKVNPETRERVLEAARKLNYTVNINARNMKIRKSGAIGLLYNSVDTFNYMTLIKGIQIKCLENETSVALCTGDKMLGGREDYIDYYYKNLIDGVIYCAYAGVPYDSVISILEKNKIPFVCTIGAMDIPGISSVGENFHEAGYIATTHLIENGFNNFAFPISEELEQLDYGEKGRLEGCRRAVEQYGKKLDIVRIYSKEISDNKKRVEASINFIKSNRCYDAYISTSHACYILLKAAAELGIRIPEELGVVSLDNDVFAPFLTPSLTTIDEPFKEISLKAAELLFEKINGSSESKKIEISPSLTIRESTKKIP